jgi:hypothetical protein
MRVVMARRSVKGLLTDIVWFSVTGALAGAATAILAELVTTAVIAPSTIEIYILHPPSFIEDLWNNAQEGSLGGALLGAFQGVIWPYWLKSQALRTIVFWTGLAVILGCVSSVLSMLFSSPDTARDLRVAFLLMGCAALTGAVFGSLLGLSGMLLQRRAPAVGGSK